MKKLILFASVAVLGFVLSVRASDTPQPDPELVKQCYPAMYGYTRLMTVLFPDDHVPAVAGTGSLAEREKTAHLEWLRTLKLTRSFALLLGREIDAQELGGKIEKCVREYVSRYGTAPTEGLNRKEERKE